MSVEDNPKIASPHCEVYYSDEILKETDFLSSKRLFLDSLMNRVMSLPRIGKGTSVIRDQAQCYCAYSIDGLRPERKRLKNWI